MRYRLRAIRRKWSTDIAMTAVSRKFPASVGYDNRTTRKCKENLRVISVDPQEDLGDPRRRLFASGNKEKTVKKKNDKEERD